MKKADLNLLYSRRNGSIRKKMLLKEVEDQVRLNETSEHNRKGIQLA